MRHGKAFLIAVVLAFGLFAACGGDDDSGGGAGAGGSTSGAGGGTAGATAGASGGAAAGPNCATYCGLAVGAGNKFCTGTLQVYADMAACTAGCAMITTPGAVTDTAGNTLGCRIYHLGVANMSMMNATTHCPHGKVASDVCK